jgi:serine/threonine protein phosphatase PrpC
MQAGSTANVCLITPEAIYVANAGDSRSVASVKGECV